VILDNETFFLGIHRKFTHYSKNLLVEPQIYYLSAGHGLPVDLYTRHSAAPELVCIYFESSDQSK